MSTYGFPDGQELTQWLGQPLEEQTGKVIGAGSYVSGPYALANFASVIVAVKAIGGNVTVKVTQAVNGGPASLQLVEQVVVAAGAVLFEAFVLFGDQVTIEFDGSLGGTSVDFAIYPSNTTTNAQVITQATINVQHNDILVAAEPTLDFEDVAGFTWGIVDDGPNTRLKITPPAPAVVEICDLLLAAPQLLIDTDTILGGAIPQTFKHLFFELEGRLTGGTNQVYVKVNNDAVAGNYSGTVRMHSVGAGAVGDLLASTVAGTPIVGDITNAADAAGRAAAWLVEIVNYTRATFAKSLLGKGFNGAAFRVMETGAEYAVAAAVSRLTLTPSAGSFDTGTRFTLYGRN